LHRKKRQNVGSVSCAVFICYKVGLRYMTTSYYFAYCVEVVPVLCRLLSGYHCHCVASIFNFGGASW